MRGRHLPADAGCRPKDYPALLDGAPGAKIAAWWDRAVDVIPAGGGKGIGIEKMLAYYGLDKAEAWPLATATTTEKCCRLWAPA